VLTRRTVQSISRIWSSRPTKCPAQGGAGSKRSMLGCDPAAGQERAIMRRTGAHLRGRIPAGAPAPRCGAPPVLAATLRAGTNFGPWHCRSPCQYSRYWLRVASRPEPKSCQRITRFIMLGTLTISLYSFHVFVSLCLPAAQPKQIVTKMAACAMSTGAGCVSLVPVTIHGYRRDWSD
jgi:hypothetical protein